MKFDNFKIIINIMLIVAMACFFFSFVQASLWGVSVTASGFEIATTIPLHEDIGFDEEDSPNPFLIVGFLCGLCGLGVTWEAQKDDKKMFITGFLSVAAVVSLWLFRTTFLSEVDESGFGGLAHIDFGWGWTLSLITYAGAAIMAFIASNLPNSSTDAQFQMNDSYSFSPNGHIAYSNKSESSSGVQKTELNPQQQSGIRLRVAIKCRLKSGETKEWTSTEFPCYIGRDASVAQIIVSDNQVSKTHAKLYIEKDAVMISDENSSNGTFVNGEKISAPMELLTGDEVRIGEAILFFVVSE